MRKFLTQLAPFALLLAGHLLAALLLAIGGTFKIHALLYVLLFVGLPLLAVQPALLATWAALGTAPLRIRLPLPLAALVFLPLFWLAVSNAVPGLGPSHQFLVLSPALILLADFLFLAAIAAWLRARFGLRLRGPSDTLSKTTHATTAPNAPAPQFTLRDLLIWVTGLAIALALGRLLIQWTSDAAYIPNWSEYWLWMGLIALLCLPNSLPALLGIGMLLDTGHRPAWRKAALALILLVSLLSGLGAGATVHWQGADWKSDVVPIGGFFMLFSFLAQIAILVASLLLSGLGYLNHWDIVRLTRTAEPPSRQPPTAPH